MLGSRCFLIGALAGFLAVPVQAQSATASPLLLRVASIERVQVNGVFEFQPQEALIFRDGLVIAVRHLGGESCRILRGMASRQAMSNLQKTIATNRIGAQAGRCFLPEVVTGAHGGDYAVTWFGSGARQHTFEVGDRFLDGCPTSTLSIIDFVKGLIGQQWASPGASISTMTCLPSRKMPG